jgi:formyltetrahydrofolate deformylase
MHPDQKHFFMTVTCASRPGMISAISTHLSNRNCDIIESAQFVDHDAQRFFQRVAFDAPDEIGGENELAEELRPIAQRFDMDLVVRDAQRRPKVLIMVSKIGHCLNDLLYRHSIGALPVDIVGVGSNHDDFRPLVERSGIPFFQLEVGPGSKAKAEATLLDFIRANDVELVSWLATCRSFPRRSAPGWRAGSSTSIIHSCRASRAPSPTTRRTSGA